VPKSLPFFLIGAAATSSWERSGLLSGSSHWIGIYSSEADQGFGLLINVVDLGAHLDF
jgi:hypothetical protein